MRCVRCGVEAHEYGTDGLSYCRNCLFYGMNQQCWKCRMYLPTTELQLFKGQWTCQYCILDLRDADRRISERERLSDEKRRKDDDNILEKVRQQERCERCGRDLITVFWLNGKKLCGTCFDASRDELGGVGPERPPMMPYKIKEKEESKNRFVVAIENKIGDFLNLFGLSGRKEKEKEKSKKMTAFNQKDGKPEERIMPFIFTSMKPIHEEKLKSKKIKRKRVNQKVNKN